MWTYPRTGGDQESDDGAQYEYGPQIRARSCQCVILCVAFLHNGWIQAEQKHKGEHGRW